jgi:hypothetical protein
MERENGEMKKALAIGASCVWCSPVPRDAADAGSSRSHPYRYADSYCNRDDRSHRNCDSCTRPHCGRSCGACSGSTRLDRGNNRHYPCKCGGNECRSPRRRPNRLGIQKGHLQLRYRQDRFAAEQLDGQGIDGPGSEQSLDKAVWFM